MINIDEIIERAPRPKGRRANVTPKKKTKAAVKPKAKVKAKAKPKRKPRRISTPRTFGEEINLKNINLPEIGSILPRPPKTPVVKPKGKPPVSKRPRPTRVDTTPKPKAPSEAELSKALKEFSEQIKSTPSSERPPVLGSIPGAGGIETINIPGVGQIQLPNVQSGGVETPPNIFNDSANIDFGGLGDRMRESDDVIYEVPENFKLPPMSGNRGINPPLGKRADGSTIYLMDDDAFDILKSREIDDPYAGYRNREDDDDEDAPPVDFQSPSEYLSEQEMQNITTPNPSLTEEQLRQLYTSGMMDYDDDYFTDTEGMFGEAGQRYGLGVNQDRIDEIAQEINFSSNQPVETLPVEDPLPVETQPTPPPAPPVNPFEGFVPRNIIGPSFDPKDVSYQKQQVADARARQTPGANIQGGGYLTYDNPILGNKQTQFGGYGQPMPTAPLMNYAGLASPTTYSTPAPDPDAQPGGPPPPPPVIAY